MSDPVTQRRLAFASILPVWACSVVGAVLVVIFAADNALAWLLFVFLVCVLLNFVLQLATRTKEGLVARISTASSGVFVVILLSAVAVLLFR